MAENGEKKLCRDTAKNGEKTSFAEIRRKAEKNRLCRETAKNGEKQMLTMKRIFEEDKEIFVEIKTLYEAAFPKNERKEIK